MILRSTIFRRDIHTHPRRILLGAKNSGQCFSPCLRRYSDTTELPNKVSFLLKQNVTRETQPIVGVSTTEIKQIVQSKDEGNLRLEWIDPPRSVLVVKKALSELANKAFTELVNTYPHLNIIVENDVAEKFRDEFPYIYVAPLENKREYARVVDFVITLGGDGTILHVSSLFDKAVPPVVSFSMGTLGFLLPFHDLMIKSAIYSLTESSNPSRERHTTLSTSDRGFNQRRNFIVTSHEINVRVVDSGEEKRDLQVMNEVNLHRGRYPHLAVINCFVDEQFLTEAVADGLIVATPTGSTAYSLSAGDCRVSMSYRWSNSSSIGSRPSSHADLSTISIVPASLDPANGENTISEECRSPTEVTVDGREVCMLNKGDFLEVQTSPYPMPCVNRVDEGVDWVKDINNLLKWNQNFVNKQLLIHGLS
ncbi:16920_t:CDS:10 [Acaulospora colombiana]|uniref:16920_t:CDS:1 n=1 Tax=Acaulospora colombiana TaxID=27376 RepID=A0ACA9LXL4_9GLOM|nr:16920_t:CDS:10 [Acaulospora colombiana]